MFTGKFVFLLSTIIFSIPHVLFSQQNQFEEILKKEASLALTSHPDSLLNLYEGLFQAYSYLDEEKSSHYRSKYMKLAEVRKDSLRMGLYYLNFILLDFQKGEFERPLENSVKATVFLKKYNVAEYYEAYNIQMISLIFLGKNQEAAEVGKSIIKDPGAKNFPIQLAKIYYHLGLAEKDDSAQSSYEYFTQALSILTIHHDPSLLLRLYQQLSEWHLEQDSLDSALYFASRAVELAQDSTVFNEQDFLLPAFHFQSLLRRTGKTQEAISVYETLQKKRYLHKSNTVSYAKTFERISYLEFLRNKQKFRFIILLSGFISVLIVLFVFIFFNSKLKEKQRQLTEAFSTNKLLLKEVNHRVKNNFQMILSLINVGSKDQNLSLPDFVDQTKANINSMAKVHDLFIQNSTEESIDAKLFFSEVIKSMEDGLGLKERNVRIEQDIQNGLLPTSKIVALGLIINELIVNSWKYAFVDSKTQGIIQISFKIDQGECLLKYKDDGIGYTLNKTMYNGIGISIINSLVLQLRGESLLSDQDGAVMEIRFKI